MYTVHTQRSPRNSVRMKRQFAMAIGLILVGITVHIGSVQAGDLGNTQLAKTPAGGESELADGFDLSFDEKAVIDGNAAADTSANTLQTQTGELNDARVTFEGVHKMTISLYPDDYRPGPASGRAPFADTVAR